MWCDNAGNTFVWEHRMFWENIMAMWLASSFSSPEFPLSGPGGWHLCPDAFKTLAGRGRPITEGGQSSSAFSVGGVVVGVRAGDMAPSTTLDPLGQGAEAKSTRSLPVATASPCILQGDNCPESSPQGRSHTCGTSHESVMKKGPEFV